MFIFAATAVMLMLVLFVSRRCGGSLPHCVPCASSLLPAANYILPEAGDFLHEVTFAELQREEADALVKKYNDEGRKAAPPPEKRFDNRQGGFRGRGTGFQRYDNHGGPQGGRGGYQSRGGPGGGGGFRGGACIRNYSSIAFDTNLLCFLMLRSV